jgi:DNA-binding CsgD family transcriptional regulator
MMDTGTAYNIGAERAFRASQSDLLVCPLTDSQIEVIHWLSLGKTSAEISVILGINEKAIARRIERAWLITGTHNRPGLVALALRKGWIE